MEIGRIIGGKYRLRREIGEGAMGSVWSATHEMLGREVAIKFLLPTLEGSETAAARFVAEAKAAARVKHRFVVDVFDFGITEDGLYYMVQELLEGVSLADCMYQGPAWSVRDVLRFTAQCLSGLEAVHQIGIVHRDLKPENIFVLRDPEGTYPKLLDFGISKWTDVPQGKSVARPSLRQGRSRRLTGVGSTIGTPAYMSPEQLCNASSMNGRADLYSMGVVLYEWLSGRVPFGDSSNPAELYRRIAERSAPSIRTLCPQLRSELSALIDRALDPEPQQRFASAEEMRTEILRILPLQPDGFATVQKTGAVAFNAGSAADAALAEASTPFQYDSEISIPGLASSRTKRWILAGTALVGGAILAMALWGKSDAAPRRAPVPGAAHEAAGKLGGLAATTTDVAPAPAATALKLDLPSQVDVAAPAQEPIRGLEVPEVGLDEQHSAPSDMPERSAAVGRPVSSPRSAKTRHAAAAGASSLPGTSQPTLPVVTEPVVTELAAPQPEASDSTRKNTKVVRTLDF